MPHVFYYSPSSLIRPCHLRCCLLCFSPAQGGLPLVTVLSILAQVCSGLRHLHSLGILHRDLRTVNVLVTSKDPLRVALADFGLSHLLTSVAQRPVSEPGMWGVDLRVSTLGSSALVGEVSGVEALGPCLWTAPETWVATQSGGVVVTAACDVYMVGGLAYELLTGGTAPFHWLAVNPSLFTLRRASRDPVAVPGLRGMMASGLYGKSVLEVAAEDTEPITWCVRVDGSPGSAGRLEALKAVVTQCLAAEPGGRPKVAALLDTVGELLTAEVAEVGPGALDSEAQQVAETTALREQLAQAHAQHAAAVTAFESQLADVALQHAAQIAAMQAAAAAAAARLNAEIAALESQLADAETHHSAEIAALQQAAAGSATRHVAEVAALRDTVSSLEAALDAHSADHEAQLAGAASRHAADMASLETRTLVEVAALREQHSKALAESVQQAQARLTEATALHDADRVAWFAVEAQLRLLLVTLESVSACSGWV